MKKIALLLILLVTPCVAQDITQLTDYGYVDGYMIILESLEGTTHFTVDTLTNDTTITDTTWEYTDSVYAFITVDSVGVDSAIAEQFEFFSPIKNVWVSATYTFDTLGQRTGIALLYHIIPEMSPAWIEDLE